MSQVINLNTVGKQREMLVRGVILALQELMQQNVIDNLTKDLSSYIALTLEEIYNTIDKTVEAWEKRGYWLKADRFRMEWSWCHKYSIILIEATLSEDWTTVALTAGRIAEKLNKHDLPKHLKTSTPWIGSWNTLVKTYSSHGKANT